MITAQILIQNNEDTIEKCIKSLKRYDFIDIEIINNNSSDKTIEICNDYKLKISKVDEINNYSKIRNDLIKTYKNKYILFIHPYENLIFNDNFKDFTQEKYLFNVIQGNILTKEIRLFKKNNMFKNPIFEYVESENGKDNNYTIYANLINYKFNNSTKIIQEWKQKEPLKFEPYYYECFEALSNKDYIKFVNLSEYCLNLDNKNKASIILRYYLSMIYLHCFNDINKANSNILTCISQKPEMAEFWCLLGDIFYKIKDYNRSIEFYKNAIIVGSQRKANDGNPIDVSKYQEYPNEMINKLHQVH